MGIYGLTMGSLRFVRAMNGGEFAHQSGVTWTLLLLASNWDMMVILP